MTNQYLSRYYIQPQWVFDCVNFQKILPVEDYFLGTELPPHLSPFVEEKEGEYVPPDKEKMLNPLARKPENDEDIDNSEEDASLDEENEAENDEEENSDIDASDDENDSPEKKRKLEPSGVDEKKKRKLKKWLSNLEQLKK